MPLYVFIFLTFSMAIQSISAIEIVSIGGACNVARAARHNNLRTTAYPLDWMIVSMQSLKDLFRDNFAHVLVPDQMYESDDRK